MLGGGGGGGGTMRGAATLGRGARGYVCYVINGKEEGALGAHLIS